MQVRQAKLGDFGGSGNLGDPCQDPEVERGSVPAEFHGDDTFRSRCVETVEREEACIRRKAVSQVRTREGLVRRAKLG